MLKQQLAQHWISTPRFDFAAVTYLHKLGFDLDRRLPELFPRGDLSIALDLADALLPVQLMQVGQDLFGALDRRLDDVFTRRRVQRRLPRSDAEETLEQTIRHVLGDNAAVTRRVERGHPALTLVAASENAQLLAIGSRGHGEFAGMLLGSVSQHCVHHAQCPVVIFRRRGSGSQPQS